MENITMQETNGQTEHGPNDIWCKFGQHWADRSQFRKVANPEMCRECAKKRRGVRKGGASSGGEKQRTSVYLEPFHEAILDVLAAGDTQSNVVKQALTVLYEQQPQPVKDFIMFRASQKAKTGIS